MDIATSSMKSTPIAQPRQLDYIWDGEGWALDVSRGGTDGGASRRGTDSTDKFSFHDLLSIFNPLQHLPVVSTVYRAATGDTINPVARVIGGALFGGPLGLLSGFANSLVEQISGKDIGDNVVAMILPNATSDASPPSVTASRTEEKRPSIGERLAGVILPDNAAAHQEYFAKTAAQSGRSIQRHSLSLGDRLAGVVLPERPSVPPPVAGVAQVNRQMPIMREALAKNDRSNSPRLEVSMGLGGLNAPSDEALRAELARTKSAIGAILPKNSPTGTTETQGLQETLGQETRQEKVDEGMAFVALAPALPQFLPQAGLRNAAGDQWFVERVLAGFVRYEEQVRVPRGNRIDQSE